jgi:hypothetical protein
MILWLQAMGKVMAQNNNPSNTLGNIYNNQGIITQGQTGNNTIIVGTPKLQFTTALGEELIRKLPTGKSIRIRSVGSNGDQSVADQYEAFLQQRGFNIAYRDIIYGLLNPPPEQKISIMDNRDNPSEVIVTIAPSVN